MFPLFCFHNVTRWNIFLTVILSELPLSKSLFFDKKWVPQRQRVWCFLLQNTVSIKMLPAFQELRCITIRILWLSSWRLRLFKCTLCHVQSLNIMSRRVAGWYWVQCFKMAKVDPVSPFYLTLLLKKATLQWGTYKYEKRVFRVEISSFVRFEIGSAIYASLPWKFLNFKGVLQRFPSI